MQSTYFGLTMDTTRTLSIYFPILRQFFLHTESNIFAVLTNHNIVIVYKCMSCFRALDRQKEKKIKIGPVENWYHW